MKSRRSSPFPTTVIGLLFLLSSLPAHAQGVPASRLRDEAPRVFIDCHQCDMNYIRREITFVTFVRDRKSADVYLMVSIRQTGGGGREYVVDFIGQGPYVDLKSSMRYISSSNDSSDVERWGLARVMKIGLVPFAAKTSVGGFLDVNFEGRPTGPLRDDRWNSWVFTTGVSGSLSGESIKRFSSLSGYFSANRITRGSKLRLSLSGSLRDSYYELDEGSISATMDSESFSGRYSRINDQVYLPMRAAATEEVLLQLRESATSYSYGLSVGVSYTFGSIFSPVVNPRFGT